MRQFFKRKRADKRDKTRLEILGLDSRGDGKIDLIPSLGWVISSLARPDIMSDWADFGPEGVYLRPKRADISLKSFWTTRGG